MDSNPSISNRGMQTPGFRCLTATLLLLFAALLTFSTARASETEPVVADSAKVYTQDAFTLAPGQWEFASAGALERSHRAFDDNGTVVDRPGSYQDTFQMGVVVGLYKGLDLSLTGFWGTLDDGQPDTNSGSGLGDLELELRWQFYRGEGWNLAYLPRVVAPMSDPQNTDSLSPGQPYWSLVNSLVASRVDGRWASSLEGSVALPVGEHRDDARLDLVFNSALGYQVSPGLQLEVEWLLEHQQFEYADAAWRSSVVIGAIIQLRPGLRLDTGYLQGLNGQRSDRLNAFIANFVFQF